MCVHGLTATPPKANVRGYWREDLRKAAVERGLEEDAFCNATGGPAPGPGGFGASKGGACCAWQRVPPTSGLPELRAVQAGVCVVRGGAESPLILLA